MIGVMKIARWFLLASALVATLSVSTGRAAPPSSRALQSVVPIALPGGEGGIGFDDLTFARGLQKLLVPAGRSGKVDLVDPASRQVIPIGGFSTQGRFVQGHGEGTTSADAGRGWIFASDRTALELVVLDPAARTVVAKAKLASGPDYVRWVETTGEVWVTEPDKERIEIFALPTSGPPVPVHKEFLAIPGGPESLIVDAAHGRAYTHLWKSTTLAVDVKSRAIVDRWPNGCGGSRGIALDPERGFLFVGCAEGKAVVLDLNRSGAIRDTLSAGAGVDIIDYSRELHHLYLPGGESATMAILGVDKAAKLSLLSIFKTAGSAHCVVADDHRQAWVCDPHRGRLLLVADPFPASE